MKKLILVRHAKSDWSGWGNSTGFFNDMERPLSDKGRASCRKISKLFLSRRLTVDLVEYSSAKRAIDTFELIKDSFFFSVYRENFELYTFNFRSLMQSISNTSNDITTFLLVGHNPAIEDLVDELVSADSGSKDLTNLRSKYPTGSIAFLELNILCWSDLKENCGYLSEFVRPTDT